MDRTEAAARAICHAFDLNPDTRYQAMPGDFWDEFPEDGHFTNSRGERCKLVCAWRKYVKAAEAALAVADDFAHREPKFLEDADEWRR